MKTALKIFFAWFFAIHVFQLIVFPSMFHPNEVLSSSNLKERFVLIWTTNADTSHYMNIAKNGYFDDSPGFYPVWPLVIKLLGANPVTAKVSSCLLTLIFILLLSKLIKSLGYEKFNEETLLTYLSFPSTFLLLAPFTEPLFLVLATSTFLLAGKKNFLGAAIFAGVASATRPIGIILFIYLAVTLWQSGYISIKKSAWTLVFAPMGLVIYAVYLQMVHGDFKLFWTAHTAGWGRSIGLSSFGRLINEVSEIVFQIFGQVKPVPINFLQVALIPFAIFLIILSFKKLTKGLWIYSVLVIAIPLSSGTYLSIFREFLAAFPLFLPFTKFLVKNKTLFYLYIFLGILFQSLLLIRFFNYEWVA